MPQTFHSYSQLKGLITSNFGSKSVKIRSQKDENYPLNTIKLIPKRVKIDPQRDESYSPVTINIIPLSGKINPQRDEL